MLQLGWLWPCPQMGLYHPLDGVTNLKYKLLYFLTPNKKNSKKKALAFNWDRCCHLVICLQLILLHYKTWLERVSKGKPSSLLGLIVSDEGKKFYNIGPRCSTSPTRRGRWGSARLSRFRSFSRIGWTINLRQKNAKMWRHNKNWFLLKMAQTFWMTHPPIVATKCHWNSISLCNSSISP